MFRILIRPLFLGLVLFSLPSLAAEKDFSSWHKFTQGDLIAETTSAAPGAVATVGLKIHLEPGWHAYWSNPGDSGAPVRFTFNNGSGVRVDRVMMPLPHRFETGPLVTFGYEKEALFLIELDIGQRLHVGQSAHVEVDAEWLVCKDVCIPAFQTFKLDLPITALEDVKPGPEFATFQRERTHIPQVVADFPRYVKDGEALKLEVGPWVKGLDFVDYFPFQRSGVSNEAPIVKGEKETLSLRLSKANVAQAKEDRVGVLVLRRPGGQLESIQFGDSGWNFSETKPKGDSTALWWMLLSAFLGGLILNLMPCVFPILSIKLLSLLKLSEAHPREVRSQNFAYVAGVLVSFIAIAVVLSLLRSAGTLVGWGFQLQSPLFLSLLVWLFFVLSLNLFGAFELDFFDTGVGGHLTRLKGGWGSFFTGVLAVIVASPCTGPFMGVALGFGVAQPTPILIGIFLALGLGLSFPYLVFAVFPAFVRILPRPGMWMIRVKQVMAFPLLLTDVWLLWVLGQMRNMNVVAVALFGCVMLAFAFWLASQRHRTWARRFTLVALCLGATYIYFNDQTPVPVSSAEAALWKPYSPTLLESLRGQRVFVNMTADWCLTCKVNERLVFSQPEVLNLLKEKQVTLIKGDWTERNEDITLFLNRFDRVGVPFYVLYSPQHQSGQPLPEVITKSSFIDWVNKEFP